MKILISIFSPPNGTFGSLTRMMALGKQAVKMGHQVKFMAAGNVAKVIEEKNFESFSIQQSTMFGLPKFISKIIENRSQKVQIPVKEGKTIGNVWFVFRLAGMFNKKYLKKVVPNQISIIKEYKPDIIITEMDVVAYITSYILCLPLVTTYAKVSSIGTQSKSWMKAKKASNWILNRYDIDQIYDPYSLIRNDRVLKIIPNVQSLDGSLPEYNTFYTGNILEPIKDISNNFKHDETKRAVFVYTGTGSISHHKINSVLVESFNKYPDIICYICSQTGVSDYSVGNIHFCSYIPAEKILPYCDLVICHGGLNTITQSLEYGVPLLLFPGPIFERRYNAEMVEKNNAGIMGEISDFNSEWICDKYEKRKKLADGVKKLQIEFRNQPGIKGTMSKIEEWIKR